MTEKSAEMEKSVNFLRQQLSSINISEVGELLKEGLSDVEYNARANDAEIFYTKNFEKVLKLLILKQLETIGTTADNTEQLMFGRGTINGFLLIQEWFNEQVSISRSRFDKGGDGES